MKRVEICGCMDSTGTASTCLYWTRPLIALDASNLTFSILLVVVADMDAAAYSSTLHLHLRDVDLTTVRSMPSPGYASRRTEGVDAAGHRLAELSRMPHKGELPVVSDTQENREGIAGTAEHSSSINGDDGCQVASA